MSTELTPDQDNGRRLVAVRRAALRRANRYRCWASLETPIECAAALYVIAVFALFVFGFVASGIAFTDYAHPEDDSHVYFSADDKVDVLKALSLTIVAMFVAAVALAISLFLFASGRDKWLHNIPSLQALAKEADAAIQKRDLDWPSELEDRLAAL